MNLHKRHLQQAVEQQIINAQQAEQLWQFWQQQGNHTPQFRFTHVLYYLGGMLAIGALSLFMTLGWESFGGAAIVVLCVLYGVAACGLVAFLQKRQLDIPAGIGATFMLVLVPLAVYGIQDMLGFWDGEGAYRDYHRWIDWRWLIMEWATLAAGAVLLWRYRYPFLVMPIAVTLWYMSMDVSEWIWLAYSDTESYVLLWDIKAWTSVGLGVLMLILALWVDFRSQQERDYAFWLYVFGVMAFWGGLTSMDSEHEWGKLVYFLMNIGLVLGGVVIQRRVFTIFGAIGMFIYLMHLSNKIFRDSWLFPIALTLIGLVMVLLGVWWQKHETQLRLRLQAYLPVPIREFLQRKGE